MVQCDISLIAQILSIIAGTFAIIIGIYCMFDFNDGSETFRQIILNLFLILIGSGIVLVEIYIFDFMKYFGFLLKTWGKALMCLFMGCFVFWKKGIRLAAAIIFWILAVLYIIICFLQNGVSPPLLQKNSQPSFQTTAADYYSD